MYRVETQISINASAARVWSLLVDFPAHQNWNPFVRSIEGRLEVGQVLRTFIQPPGSKGMQFRPTVLVAEPNRELRWKGKLLVPGLLDGEHYFKLEPESGGTVTFYQGELFSGLLVPFFKRSLDTGTRQGFIAMNVAIKELAEG